MIEINIKDCGEGKFFVTDYTLPDGTKIIKDENEPERVGFTPLIGLENHEARLNFSSGITKLVRISGITEDGFRYETVIESGE